MADVATRTIEVRTHGRFLIDAQGQSAPRPLLVGFHGYGENAERHLEQLRQIPGAVNWLLVSVQALNRFYNPRKPEEVVAGWMTRQDREQAIGDNVAYIDAVLSTIEREHRTTALVFAGFSQGVAMAYRAAALANARAQGVVALAGDVPPDVAVRDLQLPPVLIGRGTGDTWYTAQRLEADIAQLRAMRVDVRSVVYEGGHEWTEAFRNAAGEFLSEVCWPGL